MNDDKLLEFLKDYAKILREGVDLSEECPLTCEIKMPAGLVVIYNKNHGTVGHISIDGCDSPCMPVSPRATTYADLFVNLFNGYYEFMKDKPTTLKS